MKSILFILSMFFSHPLFAADRDDHECRIFVNYAVWNAVPGEFTIALMTPNQEMFFAPSFVKVHLRFHHRDWVDLTARPTHVDGKFRYYQVIYKPEAGGHSSMALDFIAYIEVGLDRWFDHNWHYGQGGYISLDRSNGWKVHDLVPHCFR